MTICDTCSTNLNIPTKLECGHYFCFLCVINSFICINCNNNKSSELNDYENYLWLYSSNYNGLWWCYDNNSNKKIECIYKDYLVRQELPEEDEERLIIMCDFPKKKKIVKHSTNYINDINNINDDSFDELVDDIDSTICVSFSDNSPIKQLIQESPESQESPELQELSYILKFGSTDYKFDFDSMKQINTSDIWKKRALKRIEIPNDIIKTNAESIIDYLKAQNILGVSGKKFDFSL